MSSQRRYQLRQIWHCLIAAAILAMLISPALMAGETFEFNPRTAVFGAGGAKGNGKADDTAAVQRAIDKMRDKGGHVRVTPGAYRVKRLIVDGDRDSYIFMEPGAYFVQDPDAPCVIDYICKTDNRTRKELRGITIVGTGIGDPTGPGSRVGIRAGNSGGYGAYGLSIYDARIERVDGAGLEITHSYGTNVRGGWFQHNGVGIKCDGANGVAIHGVVLRYNYIGAIDPQTMFGGIVEGNMSDGILLFHNVARYNFHNVYFEQNALRYPGADVRNGNDPNQWHPVAVGLDGCFFATCYDARERPNWAAHNLKGDFYLSTSGAMRFFHGAPRAGWAQFDVRGLVIDNATCNPIADVPGGFGERRTRGEVIVRQPWATDIKLAAIEKRLIDAEKRLTAALATTQPAAGGK